MKPLRLVCLLGFAAAVSLLAQVAPLNERIAVSATATPDYQQLRATPGAKVQTYVFMAGHRFEGSVRDQSLEEVGFMDLARQLAPDLARQKYLPARDPQAADLVILVHWGASQTFDDPQRDTAIDALKVTLPAYNAAIEEHGFTDPADLNHLSDSLAWAHDNRLAARQANAVLLGYRGELNRFGTDNGYVSEREKYLKAELDEARYFVVLQAYDRKALRGGQPVRPLWSTRLSVRTAGNNFREALPVLAQAGAHVFGRQLDNLVHLKANLPRGQVSLRELQILGVVQEAPENLVAARPQ